MKLKVILPLAILILLFFAFQYINRDFEKAETTIFTNATIITLEDQEPTAQAMLIKNGKIEAIGTNEEIKLLQNNQIKTVDLKGAIILPGFIDSHSHVALSAFLYDMVDLSGFKHNTNEEVWNHLKKTLNLKKSIISQAASISACITFLDCAIIVAAFIFAL